MTPKYRFRFGASESASANYMPLQTVRRIADKQLVAFSPRGRKLSLIEAVQMNQRTSYSERQNKSPTSLKTV